MTARLTPAQRGQAKAITGNPWPGADGWWARRASYLRELLAEAKAGGCRIMRRHCLVELRRVPAEYRDGATAGVTPAAVRPPRSEALPGQYAADVPASYFGLGLAGKAAV